MRYFNTEGPVKPEKHYCVPPLDRVNLDEIRTMIGRKKYFVLHAPPQTGKTTTLKARADRLNSSGAYHCLYITVAGGHTARGNVAVAVRRVLSEIALRASISLRDESLRARREEVLAHEPPTTALTPILAGWCAAATRPVVLLVDEIAALVGDSLLSLRRQMRSGYGLRPGHFPQSVILCGLRDMRDYEIHSSEQGTNVSEAGAFNIKAKSLRLGDFSEGEVRAPLAQHTAETGQEFEAGTKERVWELNCGQPWLANALTRQACFDDEDGLSASPP